MENIQKRRADIIRTPFFAILNVIFTFELLETILYKSSVTSYKFGIIPFVFTALKVIGDTYFCGVFYSEI